MKKSLFFLSISLLSLSCNDDDVAPAKETNDALVTRISRDGVTSIELFYDVDKRLYRASVYFLGSLSTYYLYEYDEDGLKELRRYKADDHSIDSRSVFTLDNFGRVINGDNYTKPDFFDEVASIGEYEYNASGELTARESRVAGDPVYYRDEYTYDGDGNLIEQQRTYYPNQEEEYIGFQYEFTPASQKIPESWEGNLFILGLSGLDDEIRYMFTSSYHYKGWTSMQVLVSESETEMSGQEYDEHGNLTRLVITRKNILNPQNPDFVSDLTYDYFIETENP